MASKLLTLMLIIMTCVSALPSPPPPHHHFKIRLPAVTSTISASPSYFFPDNNASPSPSNSAMSPDVTPLLPSPGPDSASGSSIIPTIPSNPSPPNPEAIFAPQPLMTSSPTGSMPDSSSVKLSGLFLALLAALWLVQI